jgi:enoyl-ACP reductase-like protein
VRRLRRPDEVAAIVVWLCSDQASFVTITTIPIDGGRIAGGASSVKGGQARDELGIGAMDRAEVDVSSAGGGGLARQGMFALAGNGKRPGANRS